MAIPTPPMAVPSTRMTVRIALCHCHLLIMAAVLHSFSRLRLLRSSNAYVRAMAPVPGPDSRSLRMDRAPFVQRRKVKAYGTPDAVVMAATTSRVLDNDPLGATCLQNCLRTGKEDSPM